MNTPPNWNWTALGLLFAILMSAANAVYNVAFNNATNERQDRDLLELKAERAPDSAQRNEINDRLARIETKLEILLPTSAIKGPTP